MGSDSVQVEFFPKLFNTQIVCEEAAKILIPTITVQTEESAANGRADGQAYRASVTHACTMIKTNSSDQVSINNPFLDMEAITVVDVLVSRLESKCALEIGSNDSTVVVNPVYCHDEIDDQLALIGSDSEYLDYKAELISILKRFENYSE